MLPIHLVSLRFDEPEEAPAVADTAIGFGNCVAADAIVEFNPEIVCNPEISVSSASTSEVFRSLGVDLNRIIQA